MWHNELRLNYSMFHYIIDVHPRFISCETQRQRVDLSPQDEKCLKFRNISSKESKLHRGKTLSAQVDEP